MRTVLVVRWWKSDVQCLVMGTRLDLASSARPVPCASPEHSERVVLVITALVRFGSWHSMTLKEKFRRSE